MQDWASVGSENFIFVKETDPGQEAKKSVMGPDSWHLAHGFIYRIFFGAKAPY